MSCSWRFITIGVALFLCGCLPPTTTHPIGTTAGNLGDPVLKGMWRAKVVNADDKDAAIYFHFLPGASNAATVVMVNEGDSKDNPGWSIVDITTTKLGDNRYMNARVKFSDGKADTNNSEDGTIPLLYRTEASGKIILSFMDEDAVKAAIKSGAISGTVGEGQYGDAQITADAKMLDSFMSSKRGMALFEKPFATLTKIE